MGWQGCQKFWDGLFREADGTPSSTRVLMYALAVFSCVIIGAMVHHMLRITDPAALGTWLSNLPIVITALIGLITVPYGVNRGTSLMSDLAGSYAQVRSAQAAILNGTVPVPPAAPTPAAPATAKSSSTTQTTVIVNDNDKG
jgi:hypothetical protein